MATAVNVVAVVAPLTPFPCSDKDFQLTTIQVSYNSIVCNSVEHVEFCNW